MSSEDQSYYEDVVLQAMEMLNIAVVPRSRMKNLQDEITVSSERDNDIGSSDNIHPLESDESQPFSELFANLESIDEGKREMEKMRADLETQVSLKVDAEGKLAKLMEYVSMLHGEFRRLLITIFSMIQKSCVRSNMLNLGPFLSKFTRDNFYTKFSELITQFYNVKVEDFYETIDSLQNLNKLLERSKINCADDSNNCNVFANTESTDQIVTEELVVSQTESLHIEAPQLSLGTNISSYSNGNNICISDHNAPEVQSNQSNNESCTLSQMLSSPLPSSSSTLNLSQVQHCFDNSKRDALQFYCTCGAKFNRANFISLSNHIQQFSGNQPRQHTTDNLSKQKSSRTSTPPLKCSKCEELLYTRPTYLQHCHTVHTTVSGRAPLLKSMLMDSPSQSSIT